MTAVATGFTLASARGWLLDAVWVLSLVAGWGLLMAAVLTSLWESMFGTAGTAVVIGFDLASVRRLLLAAAWDLYMAAVIAFPWGRRMGMMSKADATDFAMTPVRGSSLAAVLGF